MGRPVGFAGEIWQYLQSRRGKSRNKVTVGEPAVGSFLDLHASLFFVRSQILRERYIYRAHAHFDVCNVRSED